MEIDKSLVTEKKITILTIGTSGDVNPFIALGHELKNEGFEVTIATNDEFKSLIESYGLAFSTVVGDVRSSMQADKVKKSIEGGGQSKEFFDSLMEEAEPHFEKTLLQFKDACSHADVVISSALTLHFAHFLTDYFDIPLVFCSVNPAGPTSEFHHVLADPPKGPKLMHSAYNKTTHKILTEVVWKYVKPKIERSWNKHMPPMKFPKSDPLAKAFEKKLPLILMAYSPTLLPKPKDWSILQHVTGYWNLPVSEAYIPPKEIVDFIEAGDTPIYVGFGSMNNPTDKMLSESIIPAIKTLKQRAIVMDDGTDLSAYRDDKDILIIKYADFNWLFPKMKAIIHHGGVGTTGIGIQAGAPTLIVSFIPDQRFWGWRLAQMGAMPNPIPKKTLNSAVFLERLTDLINNIEYKNKTQDLSLSMQKENGTATAVDLIINYLAIRKTHLLNT